MKRCTGRGVLIKNTASCNRLLPLLLFSKCKHIARYLLYLLLTARVLERWHTVSAIGQRLHYARAVKLAGLQVSRIANARRPARAMAGHALAVVQLLACAHRCGVGMFSGRLLAVVTCCKYDDDNAYKCFY